MSIASKAAQVAAAALIVTIAAALPAPQGTPDAARITGRVTDTHGVALAAAHVDIIDHEDGARTAVLTDGDGHYQLPALAPAHHITLLVRCIGFVPRALDNVEAPTGPEVLNFALVPLGERVTALGR